VACGGFNIDEIAPANGNKPISSLSDFAELLCVSVMIYTRGGGDRYEVHTAAVFSGVSPDAKQGQRDRMGLALY
jgi:hypothetical protein